MSRRAAIVEEFDDDTDLPLPSLSLPNTGSVGPLLQELSLDDEPRMNTPPPRAGPATPTHSQSAFRPPGAGVQTTMDLTPYKNWTCIYPIYLDAKRAYGTGQRRIPRDHAIWWPLSKDIADATSSLGLPTLHEVSKSHPRDWENPGRVRVQWKKDGRLLNPSIRNKKALLESIAARIQRIKPAYVPPVETSAPPSRASTPVPAAAASTPIKSSASKGKQTRPTSAPSPAPQAVHTKKSKRTPPEPPLPHPPLAQRLSPYSPALVSGVLIDAVKAGMTAQAEATAGAPGTPGATPAGQGQIAGGMQKGKRKVVRVRG